jgi:Domain of unknown function (DUF4129)
VSGLSRRDRVLAFGALVAVAVLVGMAVRPGGGGTGVAVPEEPLLVSIQTLLWLIIAADVLITVTIVDALLTDRRSLPERAQRPWTVTLASYLVALVPTVLALVLILRAPRNNVSGLLSLLSAAAVGGGGRAGSTSALSGSGAGGQATWLGLAFALLIVILFLTWLFWPAPRRHPARVSARPPAEDTVSAAVEVSLEALHAIPDPRQAIIAAYSSMDRSMSRAGWPRRFSEAPVEFVTRVLTALVGMSGDLRRLTELFEIAKFSDHEVDEGMRADAIGALSGIRERLNAATAQAPT